MIYLWIYHAQLVISIKLNRQLTEQASTVTTQNNNFIQDLYLAGVIGIIVIALICNILYLVQTIIFGKYLFRLEKIETYQLNQNVGRNKNIASSQI